MWSAQILLTEPSLVKRTHLDYYHAGANIAITASYQASIPGLIKHLNISEDEAKELVKKSVRLAHEARHEYQSSLTAIQKERPLLVAGSVGPYGAFLADGSEYRGDYAITKEDMKEFHRGRVEALVDAGVDILACETMPSFTEVCALAELLADDFPDREAWFSFTLRDEKHISDGTPLSDVVKVLGICKNIVAMGVNCVKEDLALGALKGLSKLTSKPLVVYPNSGEEWNAQKRDWEGCRSEGAHLRERTEGYRKAGAQLIGGCCRTLPSDINIIAETLRGS